MKDVAASRRPKTHLDLFEILWGEERTVSDSRRYEHFLAFDAACSTCRNLASRIREAVGDKVDVRGLSEGDIEAMRNEAYDGAPPWAPTLLRRDRRTGQVRAWTGARLGINLTLAIGPAATWKVLRCLGDFDREQRRPADGSVTRKQFLRGVAGLTAGAGIVLGGAAASPALASSRASGNGATMSPVAPGKMLAQAKRLGVNADLVNVLESDTAQSAVGGNGLELLAHYRSGSLEVAERDQRVEVTAADGRFLSQLGSGTIGDAGVVTMAVAVDDRNVVLVREYTPEWDNVRSEAMLLQIDEIEDLAPGFANAQPRTVARVREVSRNGDLDDWNIQNCDGNCCGCIPGPACGCRPLRETCTSHDMGCIYLACAACAVTCAAGPIVCAACLVAVCMMTPLACCNTWESTCSTC